MNETKPSTGTGTATATAATKSLFKKRNKKKPNSRCSTKNEPPSQSKEEEEEEEPSVMEAIISTKRKRKQLSEWTERHKASERMKRKHQDIGKEVGGEEVVNNDDGMGISSSRGKKLKERLRGTFSGGSKTTDFNDDGGLSGTMGKKHIDAMEQYISSQMNPNGADESKQQQQENNSKKTILKEEDRLYAELPLTTSVPAVQDARTSKVAQPSSSTAVDKEADVGSGGTMLGGTGIAEVILPVEDRIRAVKQTEKALLSQKDHEYLHQTRAHLSSSDHQDDISNLLPTNFASGPSKRKKQRPVTTTSAQKQSTSTPQVPSIDIPMTTTAVLSSSNLPASYSHNFQLHKQEWATKKKQQEEIRKEVVTKQQEQEPTTERIGFHALRASSDSTTATTSTANLSKNTSTVTDVTKSNEERTWKNFISRHRDRNRGALGWG